MALSTVIAGVNGPGDAERVGSTGCSQRERSLAGFRGSSPPCDTGRPASSRAMSLISFRSLRLVNHRIKSRLKSLGQAFEIRPRPRARLSWTDLRAEYEFHLARGSIIERCLVEVALGSGQGRQKKWWMDTVWKLADQLSPPLPAALLQDSAAGLYPLLVPLRQALNELGSLLPYNSRSSPPLRFEKLAQALVRALRYSGLIENVIEVVSRASLVKFELTGLMNEEPDSQKLYQMDGEDLVVDDHWNLVRDWNGEIRGQTASGKSWRGVVKKKKKE